MTAPTEPTPPPRAVVEALADALGVPPETLLVDERTDYFPWVKAHRLWVGTARDRTSATMAEPLRSGSELRTLTSDNLQPVAELLAAEVGPLPGPLTPKELAQAVVRLSRPDPRGVLGEARTADWEISPDIAPSERGRLDLVRKAASQPPRIVRAPDGREALEFHHWGPRGNVDHWLVELQRGTLGRAAHREIAPEKTFLYPFV